MILNKKKALENEKNKNMSLRPNFGINTSV